jgi:hypothetical protein
MGTKEGVMNEQQRAYHEAHETERAFHGQRKRQAELIEEAIARHRRRDAALMDQDPGADATGFLPGGQI